MSKFIVLHKASEKKVTFSYGGVSGLLVGLEFSPANWTEENVHFMLKLANSLRTEVSFWQKMELPDKEFDFMQVPQDLSFKTFWNLYGNKVGKMAATMKTWDKMTDADKIECLLFIPRFKNKKQVDGTAMPYPSTFLNQKYWLADKI